jgi:hypothetical protein
MRLKQFPLIHLLLAGLLAPALAGCMDDPPPEWAALVKGSECSGAAEGKCRLMDGVLVVEGLRVESDRVVGLRIQDPTGPVMVRDLRVSGPEIGIDIGRACASCTVTVTGAEVHARSVGVRLGEQGSVESAVTLDGLKVVTGEQPGTYVFGGGTLGIYLRNQTGPLTIRDATLNAVEDKPGSRAIWHRGSTRIPLTLTNVSMALYGRGITGDFSALTLRDVNIACVYDAIYSTAYAEVDAEGLRIDGCGRNIAGCTDFCGTAIQLIGPYDQRGGLAQFRNVSFTNNTGALHIQRYDELRLDGFHIMDGEIGAVTIGVDSATIANGTVARQSQHGMRLILDRLTMQGVAFLDNGHGPTNGTSPHAGLEVAVFATSPADYAPLRILVNGCTFSGNVPFGLKNGEVPVDARFNWWGSPAGPSLQPTLDGKPLPGFGDAISWPGALTAPHLIAPP